MENKRTWALFANGRGMELDQGRNPAPNAFPPEWGDWFVMQSVDQPQGVGRELQSPEPVDPFGLRLDRDEHGRISARAERSPQRTEAWAYEYDQAGRLARVLRNSGLFEAYQYDEQGRRAHEVNAFLGRFNRIFQYGPDNRLLMAGNACFEHDEHRFRSARVEHGPDNSGRTTLYHYASDGRLLGADLPNGDLIAYSHDRHGRRVLKEVNGLPEERYTWLDRTRLDRAVVQGVVLEFAYGAGRTPEAMVRDGRPYSLYCDQVGSLRVVADETGNVVKEIVYDSFGNILEDSNPAFRVPMGFAGGLHDPDTGFVRFGYRDYDPDTGRFTAQDPIGYAGGDPDLYGYCLDDPVNLVDPSGLQSDGNGTDRYWDFNGTDLTHHDGNSTESWPGRSGSSNYDPAPDGNYTMSGKPSIVPPEHPKQKSFCDPSDNCWWQAITPDVDNGRTGLGIHPDGNLPGTEGCIGLTDDDTSEVYDKLRESNATRLEVKKWQD